MQCFEVGDKVILLMRPFLSLVLHMCENIEQIMHYSWNNCLIYKKIKIFYIQKSTVHYVTLILDDPLYISNFDTRKVMSFFQHLHVLIICTLHLLCLYPMTREKSNFEWKLLFVYLLTLQLFGNKYVFYYIFFKFTSSYILTWYLIRWWSRLQIRCCTCIWVIRKMIKSTINIDIHIS